MAITAEMKKHKKKQEAAKSFMNYAYPEHATSPSELIVNVHSPNSHKKDAPCTIHNMSNHPMRWFPQVWISSMKSEKDMGMYRECQHGILHPDPDDPFVVLHAEGAECDGCCGQESPESYPTYLIKKYNETVKEESSYASEKFLEGVKLKPTGIKLFSLDSVNGPTLWFVEPRAVGRKSLSVSFQVPDGVDSNVTLAHAENTDALLSGNATVTGIKFFSYGQDELSYMPLGALLEGAENYPKVTASSRAILGLSVFCVGEDNGKDEVTFSFAVHNPEAVTLKIARSFVPSLVRGRAIELSENRAHSDVIDFCMS